MKAILSCAILALFLAPAAAAEPRVVTSITIEDVAKILQDAGYRAEIVQGQARPRIQTGIGGYRAAVNLYDCTDANCTSIQFWVYFTKSAKLTTELANRWNTELRFAKAFIDKDGDFNLQLDVDLDGGIAIDHVKAELLLFESMIGRFDKFPKDPPGKR